MKYIIKNIIPAAALALALGVTSCTKDLDVDPIDPNLSTEVSLDGLYLKCYANLALPGNGGANGDSDIDGYDGGTAGFIRQLWNSNELPTDESICCWGDPGIAGFNFNQYEPVRRCSPDDAYVLLSSDHGYQLLQQLHQRGRRRW